MSLKIGARVRFTSRHLNGTGKIIAIKETSRGPWYMVRSDDKTIEANFRAGQLARL